MADKRKQGAVAPVSPAVPKGARAPASAKTTPAPAAAPPRQKVYVAPQLWPPVDDGEVTPVCLIPDFAWEPIETLGFDIDALGELACAWGALADLIDPPKDRARRSINLGALRQLLAASQDFPAGRVAAALTHLLDAKPFSHGYLTEPFHQDMALLLRALAQQQAERSESARLSMRATADNFVTPHGPQTEEDAS